VKQGDSHGRSERHFVSVGRENSITFLEVSKAWASRPSVLSGLKMNTLHIVKQWF